MRTQSNLLQHITILLLLAPVSGSTYAQGQLLLKSGFEPSVSVTLDMSDIMGVDQVSGFRWDTSPFWIKSSRFEYLVNRNKKITDYMASFSDTDDGTRCDGTMRGRIRIGLAEKTPRVRHSSRQLLFSHKCGSIP